MSVTGILRIHGTTVQVQEHVTSHMTTLHVREYGKACITHNRGRSISSDSATDIGQARSGFDDARYRSRKPCRQQNKNVNWKIFDDVWRKESIMLRGPKTRATPLQGFLIRRKMDASNLARLQTRLPGEIRSKTYYLLHRNQELVGQIRVTMTIVSSGISRCP